MKRQEKWEEKIQRNLGFEPMDDPFTEACQTLTTPKKYEEEIRRSLEPWQMHFGADDYVDYTWHSPGVRLYSAKAMLKPPKSEYTYPLWTSYAMGGIPSYHRSYDHDWG